MARVRTFVKGEGDDQQARLVRSETEAVKAEWDGFREATDEEQAAFAKQAEKDRKAAEKAAAEKDQQPK